MCGFVGYFGKKHIDLDEARLSISNRGPDMSGTKSGDDWKIAFNRLSIHDLSTNGMQPFEYNNIIVYMNGEIFNYIELLDEHRGEFSPLSGSDVEIIPFLYSKYGIDFLNRLNGMFAIVLIDNIEKKKFLIRDRFAEKPLYYIKDKESILFASEVKALKKIKNLEVDKLNIKINFACWFLPQPLSLYKDTFNVNPGSYIEYKDGTIIENRWYKPNIQKCKDTQEQIEKTFIDLYKSSIELRLRSDVPVGIFLSGGLDSTSIAKFANETKQKDLFAFGADIVGKMDIENNNTDIEIPVKLADELDMNYKKSILDYDYYNKNIVSIVNNYDEIFVNSGVLVFYELARLANENNTEVILTGVGGDELFGGYPWQSGVARKIDKLFNATYNRLPYFESVSKIFRQFSYKLSSAYQLLFDYYVWHVETLSIFKYDFKKDKIILEARIRGNANRYFDIVKEDVYDDKYNMMAYANTFTLIGAGNHFIDIATMKNSVENRSPFLDYRLYEFLMSVPDEMKSKYGQKGLLRKILKNHLPDYVTEAKKSGPTMPISRWFYGDINSKIEKFVLNYLEVIEDYLSSDISKLISSSGWIANKDNSLKLFAIISFIIWYKINILKDIKDEKMTFEELIDY